MPIVSSFYGINIYIYDESEVKHSTPHFHAYYAGNSCVINITNCKLIVGSMPNKQLNLIVAWAQIHKEELLINWNIALQGKLVFKINPLV